MSSEERIAASRTVAASPAEVFLIVTDPAMQVEIDGSGMLEAAPGRGASKRPATPSSWTWTGSPWVTSRWASTSRSTR